MSQERASITFKLENAEEVIALLKEVKETLNQLGGGAPGSSGPGARGGGTIGTSSAGSVGVGPTPAPAPVNPAAANPGLNPQLLPQQAFAGGSGPMFGYYGGNGWQGLGVDVMSGRFYNPANGSMLIGPTFPGLGGGSMGTLAMPPAPGPGSSIFDAMGGVAAIDRIGSIGIQAAGIYGSSIASGSTMHAERLIPGAMTVGGAIVGGAVGTMLGGPGIGTAIGTIVGSAAGEIARPIIEADISRSHLADRYRQGGFRGFGAGGPMNTQLAGIAAGAYDSARPVPLAALMPLQEQRTPGSWIWLDDVDTITPGLVPKSLQKETGTAISKLFYSPGALNQFGSPNMRMGDLSDAGALQLYAGLIKAGMGTDPSSAFTAASNLGFKNLANQALGIITTDISAEFNLKNLGAEGALAGYRYSRAGQYGSSDEMFGQLAGVQGNLMAQAGELRRQAAARSGNPEAQRAYLAQASLLEQQSRDAAAGAYNVRASEMSAMSSLEIDRSERTFSTALYGGNEVRNLPWETRVAGYRNAAARVRQTIAEKRGAGFLSRSEELQLTAEAESYDYRASFEVPREREGMSNSESIGMAGLAGAQNTLAQIGPTLRGSAIDQAGGAQIQAENLERQKQTLQQILDTSRYLTREQQIQYQTQIASLSVQQEQLRATGDIATAAARRAISMTESAESRIGPSTALIRGAGGSTASGAQLAMYRASESDIASQRGFIDDLISRGFDENSNEVLSARSQLAGMQIGLENNRRALSTVPMSGADRAERARLQTEHAFQTTGYGTWGDIRENLVRQVSLIGRQIQEQGTNRSKLRSQGLWTDAMEGDFQERISGLSMEGLGLVNEYNDGFENRLISEAVNMPSSGRLMMSRFTHREAAAAFALAGQRSPRSWGGNAEQSAAVRDLYPRMMHALGSGAPGNMLDRAIGGETRGSVDVTITVKDESGKIRDTAMTVNKGKTGVEFNINSNSQRRPSG